MAKHTENPQARTELAQRATNVLAPRISSIPPPRGYLLSRTKTVQRGAIISPPQSFNHRGPAFLSVKAVGTYVPRLTQKSFEKFGFATAALLTDWSTIVGPDLARDTVPDRLKWPRPASHPQDEAEPAGAVLVIRVDPSRALEISYKERQIVERINTYFGYRTITGLRLVQAPITRPVAPAPPKVAAPLGTAAGERSPEAPVGALGLALARLQTLVLTSS